ncbi:MAG: aldo/keto reductase [Candidatus Omnitrophica bacterium]|nr:aldo/keto reductase [Candidatus Omnitrophota bacterium]
MEYRKLGNSSLDVSVVCLGTWAFGGDRWWGYQDDNDSLEVLEDALARGVNFIDTAPVYGRGHSEEVIGSFIAQGKIREKVILATKLGLRWDGRSIFHDLSRKRMFDEIDASRKRLKTDYFDLYQVHWHDPDTPIGQTAEIMHKFYQDGIIKAIGVSNYSMAQIEEFKKYAPIHSLQPSYSMFDRDIEEEVIPFCIENSIGIITYAPLYSGLLTGKFFLDGAKIPGDINRKMKSRDLEEPCFSINKTTLIKLKKIADKHGKTLAQLALNWNFNQKGVTSAIAGARKLSQLYDNLGSTGWKLDKEDLTMIRDILAERFIEIEKVEEKV